MSNVVGPGRSSPPTSGNGRSSSPSSDTPASASKSATSGMPRSYRRRRGTRVARARGTGPATAATGVGRSMVGTLKVFALPRSTGTGRSTARSRSRHRAAAGGGPGGRPGGGDAAGARGAVGGRGAGDGRAAGAASVRPLVGVVSSDGSIGIASAVGGVDGVAGAAREAGLRRRPVAGDAAPGREAAAARRSCRRRAGRVGRWPAGRGTGGGVRGTAARRGHRRRHRGRARSRGRNDRRRAPRGGGARRRRRERWRCDGRRCARGMGAAVGAPRMGTGDAGAARGVATGGAPIGAELRGEVPTGTRVAAPLGGANRARANGEARRPADRDRAKSSPGIGKSSSPNVLARVGRAGDRRVGELGGEQVVVVVVVRDADARRVVGGGMPMRAESAAACTIACSAADPTPRCRSQSVPRASRRGGCRRGSHPRCCPCSGPRRRTPAVRPVHRRSPAVRAKARPRWAAVPRSGYNASRWHASRPSRTHTWNTSPCFFGGRRSIASHAGA